jgi:hypothetical protein
MTATLVGVVLSASAGPSRPQRTARAAAALTYDNTILPIFKSHCRSCHGATLPRTGLDLRTRGSVLEGGHSGPAVIPGSPEKSLLYKAVADGRMPPGGPKLSLAEVRQIAEWIRKGAPGSAGGGHWAFRPPVRPTIPAVRSARLVRNPIDAFLLFKLERNGLSYSPPAERRTLIRRVTYDLIGLPPTPEEVDAFLDDLSPDAYEKVVDRLLADPRYGERWARHWLDVAGYADSEGILQEDLIRPNAWRYRDYVIRSLNNDKPYDQFIREQIAGDELFDYRKAEHFTPEIEEALTATGFLRTAVDATRPDFNAHQFAEYQYRMLNDTETILATAVMGVPLQCARCHDHKYEPLSQKDYYRVQALFAGAVRPQGTLLPSRLRQVVAAGLIERKQAKEQNERVDAAVKAVAAKQDALVREYRLRAVSDHLQDVAEGERPPLLEALREETKRTPAQNALVEKYKALAVKSVEALAKEYPDFQKQHGALQKERETEERKRVMLPEIRAFYDQDANPPPTKLAIRGEWSRPGEVVEPGIPVVLADLRRPFTIPQPSKDAKSTGRRKALADWLASVDNPLTARVIVNRLWAHHFGIGIVPSVENLGRSGATPTNQPLLDWLAVELMRPTVQDVPQHPGTPTPQRPWSLKRIHRLIVTSAAYRQESRARTAGLQRDPDNTLLWRQRPRRLEAEAIRDAMLAAAGNLDPKMYGEAVGIEARAGGDTVPAGEDKGGRRSIYLLVRRSQPVTVLNTFDAPVMETNCTRRTVSTTSTQALALMNSSFISVQARQFARRILKERPVAGGASEDEAVRYAFRLAFSRTPTPDELSRARQFLSEQRAVYRKDAKEAKESSPEEMAFAGFCQALLSANEFVYVD